MFRLLLLVIALVLYGSLYPWHFDFSSYAGNPLHFLLRTWPPEEWNRAVARDVAANILFYVPVGAAAFLALARRGSRARAWAGAVVLGFGLSACVEILQIYVPRRDSSLLDVVSNTAGALIGAAVALVWRRELERTWERKHGYRITAPLLLLVGWLAYQLYPFIPFPSPTKLWWGLVALLRPAPVSGVEVWAMAAEWLAAACALDAIRLARLRGAGPARLRWLAAFMLCLPLRVLMAGRTLTREAVLGAVLALLLWTVLPASASRAAAAAALAFAIVLRDLEPFHFAARESAFSWVPFAASFEASRHRALVVILRKAYDYGAMVWLLAAGRMGYARAAALVAAGLAICEAAQRYLPGHVPESTDPLLALLMALVLWRLSVPERPHA